MKRAVALLVLLGLFATPLHLAFELHELHHDHHHHDSEQESHPAVEHELAALAKAPRLVLPAVEIVQLHLGLLPPDVRPWVPLIEPEAHSPPDVFASPPRSPRSPPV